MTNPFKVLRKQHNLESAEDYTELIADLIEEKGEARVKDIANYFGVTHVTAVRTLSRLKRDGFIETDSHKPVSLTEKGRELASYSKKRHQTLLKFLIELGVPEKIAKIDAEGIEHHLSAETMRSIEKHLSNK